MTKLLQKRMFQHLLKSPLALVGLLIIFVQITVAILAPVIAPQDPYQLTSLKLSDSLLPPAWQQGGKYPFLFGTDQQGRGVFSVILYGARSSLIVGLGVVFIAGLLGSSLGLLAGYYEGAFGTLIMRLADVFYSFPSMAMAILIMGMLGRRGIGVVIFALSIIAWVRYGRTMNGKVLSEKENAYVEAARALGSTDARILFRHLLPNCVSSIIVLACVDMPVIIMLEATLSFLGVGIPLDKPSLGGLIASGREYLYAGKWWLVVFPGLTLMLLVVGINLLGDWLRVEINPKIDRS